MRMGVPASSVNCLEGCGFLSFASRALGMGAMRVSEACSRNDDDHLHGGV